MTKLAHKIIGEGPDLVFLHGWAMHSRIWQPLEALLSARYRLTLVDLPGHGMSRNCYASSPAEVLEQLLEIVPEQAGWIGWSLGGQVATQFALQYPQRISRLMMIASNPCFVRNSQWPDAVDASVFLDFAVALEKNWEGTIRRFMALQFLETHIAKELLRTLQQEMSELPADLNSLRLGLEWLRTIDLSGRIADLEMPLQYLLGQLDRVVPVQLGDTLVGLGFDVKVIAGAGHVPFVSHPEDVCKQVTEFFA